MFLLFLLGVCQEKNNKSGVVSVQVIDKSGGRYRVVKTIGSSRNAQEVERLVGLGKEWIKSKRGC